MRTPVLLKWLGRIVTMAVTAAACHAGAADLAAQYHFAGADDLSLQTNFDSVRHLFYLPPSIDFRRFVERRFANYLAANLPLNGAPVTKSITATLQPLIEDFIDAESVASYDASPDGALQFVVALRLDPKRALLWDENLAKSCQSAGDKLSVGTARGLVWGKGSTSLWLLHSGEWLVIGRGTGLQSDRDETLERIKKQGRPAPALTQNFFEANIDWAKLEQILPISLGDLKAARTQIEIKANPNRIFHLTAHATYPQAISWNSTPWHPPMKIISDPLVSFTAARDISPFLREDPFNSFAEDPFQQQFFSWAESSMPFQNYFAWPVANATNSLRNLSTSLPAAFTNTVKTLDHGTLRWFPASQQLIWNSPMLRMAAPFLTTARSGDQSYLLVGMFPLGKKAVPPPADLFAQFGQNDNIVYYAWEDTGRRLEQWRLLSEILPVVHKITPAEAAEERKSILATTNAPKSARYKPSFAVVDNWLSAVASSVLGDTSTEITKTGPAELTIKRRSPFIFTGFELELLTHWMAHAPSVGHIDPGLLPPPAKVTGPGMPH